jgi:hypothetical protein
MDIAGFMLLFIFDEVSWNNTKEKKSYWGLGLIIFGFVLQIGSNYMLREL